MLVSHSTNHLLTRLRRLLCVIRDMPDRQSCPRQVNLSLPLINTYLEHPFDCAPCRYKANDFTQRAGGLRRLVNFGLSCQSGCH